MRIIGYGFLARNLAGIADRHPDTVVLAAGVSWASGTSTEQFDRESTLVRETAARCRADGTRLLFFSTASTGMYGLGQGHEDEPVRPSTPYGRHKYGLELALRDSGVDFRALRLSHLVGPHQPAHQLLPALISQIPDDFPPDYHRPVLDRYLRSAAPSGPVPIFF